MAACFALPLAAWCRAQPRTEGSILQTSAKAPAIPAPCRLFSKRSSFFGDSVTSLCAPPRVFIARQPATTMEYRIKVDREKSARMRREKRDKMLDQRKVNVAQRRQQRRARLRDEEEEQRNTAEPSKGQIIQWYPGHIAKAERDIKASLSLVDLLLEIRDARIPMSTSHPDIEDFVSGGKGRARIMILNRLDMVSPSAKKQWNDFFKREGIAPVWTNARSGEATEAVVKAAVKLSQQVNERRTQRGMLPRPVRACVIGFPNVGKSALINRLMKRRVVDSARRAGVTKSLKWNTLGDTLQLLDAPGILPMNMSKRQADAVKLAICDDIGEASYNYEKVAAAFIDVVALAILVQETLTNEELEPESRNALVAFLSRQVQTSATHERSYAELCESLPSNAQQAFDFLDEKIKSFKWPDDIVEFFSVDLPRLLHADSTPDNPQILELGSIFAVAGPSGSQIDEFLDNDLLLKHDGLIASPSTSIIPKVA
eukprot:tig00000144_g9165.t1